MNCINNPPSLLAFPQYSYYFLCNGESYVMQELFHLKSNPVRQYPREEDLVFYINLCVIIFSFNVALLTTTKNNNQEHQLQYNEKASSLEGSRDYNYVHSFYSQLMLPTCNDSWCKNQVLVHTLQISSKSKKKKMKPQSD